MLNRPKIQCFDKAPRSDAREALRQNQQRAQKELELKKIPSDLLAERSSGHTQYQVRRGDTLTAIARRFGASLEAILQLNRVVNGHRIFPGQILLIPVEA